MMSTLLCLTAKAPNFYCTSVHKNVALAGPGNAGLLAKQLDINSIGCTSSRVFLAAAHCEGPREVSGDQLGAKLGQDIRLPALPY